MAGKQENGSSMVHKLLFDLEHLTVYRGIGSEGPLVHLKKLLEAYIRVRPQKAIEAYYKLSIALFEAKVQRCCGNLLQDYILCQILESDNAFARKAAEGVWDVVLYEAAKRDLTTLQQLFSLELPPLLLVNVQ